MPPHNSLRQDFYIVFNSRYLEASLVCAITAIATYLLGTKHIIIDMISNLFCLHYIPEVFGIFFTGIFLSKINIYGFRFSFKFMFGFYLFSFIAIILSELFMFGYVTGSLIGLIYLISVPLLVGYLLPKIKSSSQAAKR